LRLTIKLGGSILEKPEVRQSILKQISALRSEGHEIVLVHGGGKSLSRRLAQLGIASEFIGGLRVTDAATLQAALMVLAGEVNKGLVLELGKYGTPAVGICGVDASAVRCRRLSEPDGFPRDLGFVGRPVSLDREFFDLLLGAERMPVVASIAVGEDHRAYNVNADEMASICAWGTGCEALVYLTDVSGVCDENGEVLAAAGKSRINDLRAKGVISGGMLPKTASCLEALAHGVPSVHILPGTISNVLRTLIDGKPREGTTIYGNG